ncbi:adhesion G- coupled receptor G4 isoform X2 [Paramuricea clavata]|uniref:Adhesion G- coupled receptor G4 isoform X2 n=1 Tax=Paramuricea clavata TaxID=317549 RepID=A0A6S7IU17_PARCT|nr:adhesion G- coupled receptor G4 isoform X2 [Paramuricea clavata]
MQLWTFGLILLLILSSWMYLSTADEQDDDGDDDEYDENEDNPNCRILKEKVCRKNKKRNRECEETIYFNCKPTCRSYVRSTKTETSKQYITTTIYLCSTSTISSSRSIPISSTVAKISITPSFPMPSSIDYNSGSGSGDDQESDDDLISSSVSLSPSLSTVTSSPLSSALPITPSSSFGDRTVGENVFSSVVPSFTVQFPSSFPSTATATLSAESSVSSISPSPSLRTAAPSSSHRNDDDDDDKCDDDDNDGDDDGDDGNDDGDDDGNGDGDDDDDSGKSDDDATVDTSIITQEQDGTYDLEKVQNRKRESSSKQKSSCKTSSVIQSTKLPYSLIKTAQKHIISSTPSTIIATTNSSRPVQPNATSYSIAPSATSSNLSTINTSLIKTTQGHISSGTPSKIFTITNSSRPVQPNATSYSIAPSATSSNLSTINTSLIKTTQGHISSGTPSKIFTITNSSHPVRPNATSYSIAPSVTSSNLSAINTSVIKTTQGQISSGTPSKIFTITNSSHPVRPNATSYSISPSVTSSVSPAINTSTLIPKPDTNGTEISTKTIFPSSLISPSASFFSTSATRCHPGTNGTEMTTKMIFPSTSVPISGSYTLTASPTLPLSSSIMSESSRSIAPTPVLSSSSWEHSKMNSTVISSSLNATLNQSRTITPTMTTTVMVSSSILTQVPTVHCGEIETGDKFEKGILTWQRTPVGSRANTSCPYNKTAIAYRWCRIANKTQYWEDVHDENCSVLEKQPIEELINENITEENEERIAVLMDYITSTSNVTVDLVKNGAEMLDKLVAGATNLSKIRKELLSSVSNVMNADPTVLAEANKEHNSTNKILTFIGKLLDDISLSGKKFIRENLTNLVAEAWDVANKTEDLIFENISQDKDEDNDSLVSVKMPRSLVQRYKEKQRITFINFLNDKLFPQDGDVTKKFINSKIVSVSVKGDKVRNLSDPIVIEFKITNSSYANNCSCVFWDFEADGGLGRWSSNGCVYEIIGDGRSRCSCSHLTHFGILVDLFPDEEIGDTDQLILEGITFVGCYLSIVGLVLTIITLLSFKQYRNGVSGQILLNLCLALLFSLVIFLGGIEQVDDEGTCVTVAALLHYFVLVAVLWMGVEAFHMFVNIVLDTLPDELGRTFVFKCAAVAWGKI